MSAGEVTRDVSGSDGLFGSDSSMWELDLHPPLLRSDLVFRSGLVDRLRTTEADVVTVIAPAGYGKTTMLTQWSQTTDHGFAWLTLGDGDNDLRRLLLRLTWSLARAVSDKQEDMSWLLSAADSDLTRLANRRLVTALSQIGSPFALVLDNVQVLRKPACVGALAELVRQMEGHAQVLIASRSAPKLPLARWRARRSLLELTEADLALSQEEVAHLLDGLAASLSHAGQLMTLTEGWPAAISLLVGSAPSDGDGAGRLSTTNEHRHLADYVRNEILPQLSKNRRDFLTRVSALERVSGPLADAVIGTSKSSKFLEDLAGSTHLVHPIDAPGAWYEMNPVLRRVLQSEFEQNDPGAPAVHARAAAWYGTNNMPLEAIGHAQKAGDVDEFVKLMQRLIKSRYATGHVADVLLWMDWLQTNVALDQHPGLAAIGALVHIQEGNALEAERWLDAATRVPADSDTDAVVWLVRASATRSGVEPMAEDIETALRVAGPGSRWLPAILVTKGLAHLMSDQLDMAEPCFVEAARLGLENESLASVVLALGHRALLAIDRQDWGLALELADQAVAIIDEYGHEGYHTSGLALIAAARLARRANDIPKTQTLLARASLIRPRLSAAMPGESVQILVEMARAHIELSDVVGARALIREAEDIVLQRPDLGVFPGRLETLKESLTALGPGTIGLSALTKAELRLLPFLATNLSFPEIGEQLFISRHTVKTQAMSIYRKLGTSSRSDAVAKAYEFGLLKR